MKILLLSCLLITTFISVNAKILHSEKSLYRNISIEQRKNQQICMVFGRLSKYPDYQSCYDPENPNHLVFSYTKLIMAGLAIKPNPESILIIGLGGGTLPMTFENIFPESQIDSVEIDSAVLRVAKRWFKYQETEHQKTHLVDGRVFVKRQLHKGKKYDLIILDAFNGDYIPEHMMTAEFLGEAKSLMNDKALLIANTFTGNKLYHHESATYQKVFGQFDFVHSKKSGNRVIYIHDKSGQEIKLSMSEKIVNQLESIGVDFEGFSDNLTSTPDWDEDARPLTDQYSPANLLNQ